MSHRKFDQTKKCNDKVTQDTMTTTGESKQVVEHAISFIFQFIATKIEEGSFETVKVPTFGSFRPKHRSVQQRDYMRALNVNYRNIIRKK